MYICKYITYLIGKPSGWHCPYREKNLIEVRNVENDYIGKRYMRRVVPQIYCPHDVRKSKEGTPICWEEKCNE